GNPPSGVTSYPPLLGVADVKGFEAHAEAVTGSGLDLSSSSPAAMRLTGVGGNGSNRLNANSEVSCTSRRSTLVGEGATGTTTVGGAAATAGARSDGNAGPATDAQNVDVATATANRPPLSFTATTSGSTALQGTASCTADATTTAATLPSETGQATSTSGRAIQVNTAAAALPNLTLPLGNINMVEYSATSASHSAAQTQPSARRMNVTATHSTEDIRLVRPQTGSVLSSLMPDGLVRVLPYESSVSAVAHAGGGQPSFSPDASKPLRIQVWDGNVSGVISGSDGNALVCAAANRAGNYCQFTLPVNVDATITVSRTFCADSITVLGLSTCVLNATVDTVVTLKRPVTQTFSPDGGITQVYRATYAPARVVTRLTLRDSLNVVQTDLRSTLDLGRVDACARYGSFPGGCGS
ncbi:MAG TPA: hypothetical protein VM840_04065, partial [Actinomycetota bacterium]|nr:hypothetical protein [Actinomycetota bacterium]